MPPIATFAGILLSILIGGAVLVERVFSWGGAAQYAADAVLRNDYPAVQAFVVVAGAISVFVFPLVDLLYTAIDVVLDAFGSTWPQAVRCLRPGGRAVVFGAFAGDAIEPDLRVELAAVPFQRGQFSLLGTTMGSPRDFAAFLEFVDRGSWTPVIDSVRPLAEAAAAHKRMEARRHFGKLVLRVAA